MKAKRGFMVIAIGAALLVLFCLRLLDLAEQQTSMELTGSDGIEQTVIDFQGAILGESREQQMYVVLEQDVTVDSRISQTVLDLAIFEKTRTVQTSGTGCYAVDLSKLTEADIAVNEANKTVSVTVPQAVLYTVEYDMANSTVADDTQGLLAFGELKLTLEQTNELQQSIDATLREALETDEMFDLANETAGEKIQALFAPVVSALSDAYTLQIEVKG